MCSIVVHADTEAILKSDSVYRNLQEVFTENFHHLDSECNSQNQKQSQQSKQPEA